MKSKVHFRTNQILQSFVRLFDSMHEGINTNVWGEGEKLVDKFATTRYLVVSLLITIFSYYWPICFIKNLRLRLSFFGPGINPFGRKQTNWQCSACSSLNTLG